MGACLQSGIILISKSYYALLPAVSLLAVRFIDSFLMAFGLKSNIYMKDAILKKVSALSIDKAGNFTAPAEEKIAILPLGAKANHPWGVFAPGFKGLFDHLNKMNADLDHNAAKNGFLGQTAYTRSDERGALEFVVLTYWRNLEVLHDFAHSPVHREAWIWWEKTLKEHDFLGINHEIYEADKGHWENVYVNFQPTGLGATTYLRKGATVESGKVDDQYISPLVDVSRGRLAKSSGRLGWDPTKHDERSPAMSVY